MQRHSEAGVLRKFMLYETRSNYWLVGRTKDRAQWRLLKFSRLEATELAVTEDPVIYNESECSSLLARINNGNQLHGGSTKILQADAVLGCFKFLEGYYLLFATKKRLHGNICGEKIYGVASIGLVSVAHPSVADEEFSGFSDSAERKYRKLLSGVELTKNFFFSYTYPLWRTLQANMSKDPSSCAFDSMFVWNDFLTRPLRTAIGNATWTMPVIHGFWQQRTIEALGRMLRVTLVARRSRQFAGTRYRRRGINSSGHVANDVETEQIVYAGRDWGTGFPVVSSVVQVRGSIPLFWNQDSNQRLIKPDIQLQRFDPLFAATRLHFKDLAQRYGHPIIVLNLVKSVEKRPRESLLCREYSRAVSYVNNQVPPEQRVTLIAWDFHAHAKQRGAHILTQIAPIIDNCLQACEAPEPAMQRGVLRTNCIDCLDRTNVAQFAFGHAALGRQLHGLGLVDTPQLDLRAAVAVHLMHMYEAMGNVIARQYGGSQAHSTVFERERGDWEPMTLFRDKLTSFRRFVANSYTDAEKQDAINLFLGNFIPLPNKPPLWSLDSDYYLHSGLGRRFVHTIMEPAPMPQGQAMPAAPSGGAPPASGPGPAAASQQVAIPGAKDAHSEAADSAAAAATLSDEALRLQLPVDKRATPPPSLFLLDGAAAPGSGAAAPDEPGAQAMQLPEHVPQHEAEAAGDSSAPEDAAPGSEASKDAGQRLPQTVEGADEASGQPAEPYAQVEAIEPAADLPAAPLAAATQPMKADGVGRGGIMRFRAPARPAQLPKLASFDRIIGKAPNALLQGGAHPHDPAGSKAYLPQWLASPLGVRRIASEASMTEAGSRRSTEEAEPFLALAPSLPAPAPRQQRHSLAPLQPASTAGPSTCNTGAGLPERSPHDIGLVVFADEPPAAAALPRSRSFDFGRPRRPGASAPLSRRESTAGVASWAAPAQRAASADLGQLDVLDAGQPQDAARRRAMGEALAPDPRYYGGHGAAADGPSRRRVTFPALPVPAFFQRTPVFSPAPAATPPRAPSRASHSALPHAAGLGSHIQTRDKEGAGRLGLPRAIQDLWEGSQHIGRTWWEEEARMQAVYSTFLQAAGHQMGSTAAAMACAHYTSLCRPLVPVSLEGFAEGPAYAWCKQAGLIGASDWSKHAMKELAASWPTSGAAAAAPIPA